MNIERIYIPCYKKDIRLAQISVASIRQWYHDIPITLLKDYYRGPFSTKDLECYWNVQSRKLQQDYGSPFSKIEPLFDLQRERCLFLDADTCFVGKALSNLSLRSEDFVVQYTADPQRSIEDVYFDTEIMRRLYPDYTYPLSYFNAGQFIGTTGILSREDFSQLVDWKSRPVKPKIGSPIKLYEEAALNFLFPKLQLENRATVGNQNFWFWSEDPTLTDNRIKMAISGGNESFIIHWAGATKPRIAEMSHGNLLCNYQKIYYSKLPLGQLRYMLTKTQENIKSLVAKLRNKRKTR
jgi:hypothetical protein